VSIRFSPVIAAQDRGTGSTFSVKALDLADVGDSASPVIVLDDFRVKGRPFPPHPHAGFAAVTYVFEDSPGGLRSRDSLGNDVVAGPSGIVWTQTGSGLIHEELPADSNLELHGLQTFVNLSSKNRLAAPQMLRLKAHQVSEWRSEDGDRVRGQPAGVVATIRAIPEKGALQTCTVIAESALMLEILKFRAVKGARPRKPGGASMAPARLRGRLARRRAVHWITRRRRRCSRADRQTHNRVRHDTS
jgi:redox-sensitive bicupin YhaK (pirin superfamily)